MGVSALKYRPRSFDEVVGQEHITRVLGRAVARGQLAQALLFCGPHGVGKTTCARIVARALNCQQVKEDGNPCNECEQCRQSLSGKNIDVVEMDAASNNSVEHVRQLIEQVRIPPLQGKYKVYIIDEVHMLSQSAFNAFLKTLEEPPPYAVFVLATTEKHKVLPTVVSRCQVFEFRRLSVGTIVERLKAIAQAEQIKAEPEALHLIAERADGSLRDALMLFDRLVDRESNALTKEAVLSSLHLLDRWVFFGLVDELAAGDLHGALARWYRAYMDGFSAEEFMEGLAGHLRDLLLCLDEATQGFVNTTPEGLSKLKEQAERLTPSLVVRALRVCSEWASRLRTAKDKTLVVDNALIELAYIGQLDRLQTVREGAPSVARLQSNKPDNPPAQNHAATLPAEAKPNNSSTTPSNHQPMLSEREKFQRIAQVNPAVLTLQQLLKLKV